MPGGVDGGSLPRCLSIDVSDMNGVPEKVGREAPTPLWQLVFELSHAQASIGLQSVGVRCMLFYVYKV